MKKLICFLLMVFLCVPTLSEQAVPLEDGLYVVKFQTDSSMFRVNEAHEGMGLMRVQEGEMLLHVTLMSKKIVNLYEGLASEAKAEGAVLLEPSTDKVTYPDGWVEEAYGFTFSVPAIGETFPLAIIGTKGKWYDHKVQVTEALPFEQADRQLAQALLECARFAQMPEADEVE